MMARSHHGAPRRFVGARHPLRTTLICAGIVLLVAGGIIWHRAQPAPNVGAAEVTSLAANPPSPVPSPSASGPVIPVRAGTLPTAAATVVPARIDIPKLHLTATITPVGVDASDNVVIPANVKVVGWYEFGPGLDDANGSMVIAGHVDNSAQGNGAFFHLRNLAPGDTFSITGSDNSSRSFRVVAREEYPKATIQLGRYFATTGAYRVTLMTCGGTFNSATGHYEDNIAVTAVPE